MRDVYFLPDVRTGEEGSGMIFPDWDENEVTCPKCGHKWGELWDYDWGEDDNSFVETECPNCDCDLTIRCERVYRYAAFLPVEAESA